MQSSTTLPDTGVGKILLYGDYKVIVIFLELGGAVQLMGIMKLLIDPENMLATALVSFENIILWHFAKNCTQVCLFFH